MIGDFTELFNRRGRCDKEQGRRTPTFFAGDTRLCTSTLKLQNSLTLPVSGH
jgi:hypothetical protein